jgi:hypothetical protein
MGQVVKSEKTVETTGSSVPALAVGVTCMLPLRSVSQRELRILTDDEGRSVFTTPLSGWFVGLTRQHLCTNDAISLDV